MSSKLNYSIIFSEYPDILTVSHIQKMLGISRHYAYSLIASGEIQGIKIGRAYKVPKVRVIDYVLAQKSNEKE